jgi:7-cyano-7-deazaguanine synthase
MAPRAVVLLSGGLDSATTLAYALDHGFEAHALTVNYGQRHMVEIDRAAQVAAACGAASHRVVSVEIGALGGSALTDPGAAVPRSRTAEEIGSVIPTTYVPARNTVFLALALGWAEVLRAQDLFIGANAVDYSGYPDCRPGFLEQFERLARVATKAGIEGARIRVHAPLIAWSKAEIIRESLRLGVDLAITVSCYDPNANGSACGACDACLLRAKGFREAGIRDPAA